MKATAVLQKQQEERALQRAQLAPMRPEWIYRRQGWNSFTREDITQPGLAEHPPLPTEDARLSDPRLAYHAHLKLVSHQGYDEVLLTSFRAVMVNSERREGILDRVIDGMSGTGKSLLLRAIGRTVQRDIEDRTKGAWSRRPQSSTSWRRPTPTARSTGCGRSPASSASTPSPSTRTSSCACAAIPT
ncbi:hypothetical protein AB0G29_35800 [Streptomyces parvus]|uniref:hypothetical protein n=1 Tax=Streptomyces parvus TaxID=66428 RepID=UPI0033F8E828